MLTCCPSAYLMLFEGRDKCLQLWLGLRETRVSERARGCGSRAGQPRRPRRRSQIIISRPSESGEPCPREKRRRSGGGRVFPRDHYSSPLHSDAIFMTRGRISSTIRSSVATLVSDAGLSKALDTSVTRE